MSEMTVFDGDFFLTGTDETPKPGARQPRSESGRFRRKAEKKCSAASKRSIFFQRISYNQAPFRCSVHLPNHASVHLKHMVAENPDILGIVAGEQNGFSLFLFSKQQGADFFDTVPVKAIKRFIKD